MATMYTCTACLQSLRREQRLGHKKLNLIARNLQQLSAGQDRRWQYRMPFSGLNGKSDSFIADRIVTPYRSLTSSAMVQSQSPSIKPVPPSKILTEAPKSLDSKQEIDPNRLVDAKGNLFALASIPENVRTLRWRSADWTWGVTERLFEDCEQAKVTFELEDYVDEEDGRTRKRVKMDDKGMHAGSGKGWWFDEVGLPQTFNTYAMVCFLHMWMLKVRLRQWPKAMSEHLSKMLTDHFFWKAEETMDFVHKMTSEQRHKHMDHYFQVWTGTLIAYDEGFIKGDAILASAIWRLMFLADQDVDPLKVVLVTNYVRKELARLAWLDDKIIMSGYVGFGEPPKEEPLERRRSPSS